MKPSTILTVAVLSGITVLTALGLALTVHYHPHELSLSDQGVNQLPITLTPQRPRYHPSLIFQW